MGFKLAQTTPTKPPLEERIATLRGEIDAIIDEIVDRDAGCGIPRGVLRNDLTRHSNCQCAIYKMLASEGKLT
jgi:hypothetical protein